MTYQHSRIGRAETSVQQPNLPYNQGNQQFDGHPWPGLTLFNYTKGT
jgi:hypothetical protein